jgi:endonuclease IV
MARVGMHISRYHSTHRNATIVDHIVAAFGEAEKEGLSPKAASLFIMGPRDHTIHIDDSEAGELKEFVEKTGTAIVSHAAYPNLPWKGNPLAAEHIREELRICAMSGILGHVVHLPVGPQEWVWKYLPRLYTEHPVRIYLEHVASLPKNAHYETPAKIANLFRGIKKFDPSLRKVGFCIDTSHIWACGVDISSFEKAERWLNDLEAISDVLPPQRIMIHLNDNRFDLGAGKDEHSALLEGAIWSKYKDFPEKSGLAAFIDYAMRNDTIVILERKPAEKLLGDYRALLGLQPALGENKTMAPDSSASPEKA